MFPLFPKWEESILRLWKAIRKYAFGSGNTPLPVPVFCIICAECGFSRTDNEDAGYVRGQQEVMTNKRILRNIRA
jgi:hypothetical protein